MFTSGGGFELIGGFWAIARGDSPPCDPCDMNGDGGIDALDIEPFLFGFRHAPVVTLFVRYFATLRHCNISALSFPL